MWRSCFWTHEMTWSKGRNKLTQEVLCEQIVSEHPWGCEEIVPEHSGGLGSQGRNELTQEVPCEQIVPEHSGGLEPKKGMNSPRKSHVNRLFLNTMEDLKPRKEWTHPGSPMWTDCSLTICKTWSQGRNKLTKEVPCEEIVPEHPWGCEEVVPEHSGRLGSQGMNELTQEVPCEQIVPEHPWGCEEVVPEHSGRLEPKKEWTHPGSPMWTDCSSTLWRTWTQKKEWTHPGSPMWTDCFWTLWRTWSQGRNELTQEVPCEQIVSEHSGRLEAKEGMSSPRKSHVNRLFLNTLEDLKPRKEWTHPGSPM